METLVLPLALNFILFFFIVYHKLRNCKQHDIFFWPRERKKEEMVHGQNYPVPIEV
jgi:hypothetical protein